MPSTAEGDAAGPSAANSAQYDFQRLQPKVFCLGLTDGAVRPLGVALRPFGYRSFTWKDKSRLLTIQFYSGRYDRLLSLAERFDVFEGLPWSAAYAQLDAHFPNALFILTVGKSESAWLDAIGQSMRGQEPSVCNRLAYGALSPDAEPDVFRDHYRRHNAAVHQYFAGRTHKLLEVCLDELGAMDQLHGFLGIKGDNRPQVHSPAP